MLRFLLSIEEQELGDNVAEMIGCSTDESLLRTSSSNATPTCSETRQRFIIYPVKLLSATRRFVEALSNLTRYRFDVDIHIRCM